MATIRKRAAGVWEVRVFTGRNAKGKPTQVSRTVRGTKRDAERLAAELSVQRPTRAAGRTVGELLDHWLDHNADRWAVTTRRDQASRARLIQADPIAQRSVAGLEVEDVDRWLTDLRRSGVGVASVRNQHLVLRAALTHAVRWRWVTSNVAALAAPSRPRRAPRAALTADEVRAVLAAARSIDPGAEIALRLAAVAGLRRGEIAALQWTDIEGTHITVDSAAVVDRTGGVTTVIDAPTKTANRRRVALDPDTASMIDRLRVDREPLSRWLFGMDGHPPHPDRIGWWWKRARALAELDPKWRLHDLRHWSATTAIGGGHDVRTVANRLGHANASMTLGVYAHALPSADEALALAMGEILAVGQVPSTRS
jgi:integrase